MDPGSTNESLPPVLAQLPHHLRVADKVSEIFETPLVGSYSWDYRSADARLKRLYELGKKLNWNASLDINWNQTIDMSVSPFPEETNIFIGYPEYEAMSEEDKIRFDWHRHCRTMSQFLHGEQGALLVASQLVSCAPTHDAKLYAASQTFDEGRHVEVFSRYILEKMKFMYPISPELRALLDKILGDPRWDLKFIGMQIIIEGLALAAFNVVRAITNVPLVREILKGVILDESRHVAFGMVFMEEFVPSLPLREREERAMFAYEACVVMRERLVEREVFETFGWDADKAVTQVLESTIIADFRDQMFSRIIPNLKKVGLLTDNVKPLYERLGILRYEDFTPDSEIEWAKMEAAPYS